MANWKSPGPDQVQGYWLKHLTSLHERLAQQFQSILDDPSCMPSWLTTGRTVLIQKDQTQGNNPSNYRPITCLPTSWKLLSGTLTDRITQHLNQHDILAYEQKESRSGCRGTEDQLLIDKVLSADSKQRKANLAMGWIDYKKAYDTVPHFWIIQSMELHMIDHKIINLVQQSVGSWNTALTFGDKHLANIKIKGGIFQGDALSSLLFCVAINPLSYIRRDANQGYN